MYSLNSFKKGLAAGLIATIILSILMLVKSYSEVLPQFNVINQLTEVSNRYLDMPLTPVTGWLAHFFIGIVIWGGLFGLLNHFIPGKSELGKGLWLSIVGWLLMMIVFMPMAGAGFFAMRVGPVATLAALMLHLVFGAVLGYSYAKMIHVPATRHLKIWVEA